MVKYKTHIAVCLMLMNGCVMGELPVDPPPPGVAKTIQVEMGSDYGTQVFYNVRGQYVAGTIEKTAWDIGLMRQANQWQLRLNTALGGGAARVEAAFEQVSDHKNLQFDIDLSSGHPDSTAIALDSAVYVIDRGYDPDGNPRGYHKLQVIDTSNVGITLRLATIHGQRDTTLDLLFDTTRHITPISFTDYSQPEIPHKADWDIFFTQYMYQFRNPPVAYLVTGVLLHPNKTLAAVDTQQLFSAIDLSDMPNYTFSTRWDAIGYDWKTYNYNEGLYEVDTNRIYVLETQDNRFFKLQFLDFYTASGDKGAPLFRLQPL